VLQGPTAAVRCPDWVPEAGLPDPGSGVFSAGGAWSLAGF